MHHLLSRLGLKIAPPAVVYRLLRLLGQTIPLTIDEGILYGRTLRSGTCLSRSIAVASRIRDARVVIGVTPLTERPVEDVVHGMQGWNVIRAHAWVEIDGAVLPGHEAAGAVIGTLASGRRGGGRMVRQENAGKELVR
jgi:hypothetical protein